MHWKGYGAADEKSMDNEYNALIDKQTWEVVLPPPPNANIVSSHWTYVCKHNQERKTRPKSHIVAQGFTETFGVDYSETYALVS